MQAQEKRNIIRKPKGEKMDIKKRSRLEEFNKLMKNKVYGETDLLK